MAPGEIRGPDQDAVRLPHHQARVEDARAHADARGGAARRSSPSWPRSRPPRRATGWPTELAEKLKGMRSASDDELRKLQNDVVDYNTTEWAAPRRPDSRASAPTRSSPTRPGRTPLGKISTTAVTTARGVVVREAVRGAGRPECRPSPSCKARLEPTGRPNAARRTPSRSSSRRRKELASGTTLAAARRPLRHRRQDDDRVRSRRADPRARNRAGARRGRLPHAAGSGRPAGRRSRTASSSSAS